MSAAVGETKSDSTVITAVVSTVPMSGMSVMKNAATEITSANGTPTSVSRMRL
jgi:hypothetical protein